MKTFSVTLAKVSLAMHVGKAPRLAPLEQLGIRLDVHSCPLKLDAN